jgi:hypothetical protein
LSFEKAKAAKKAKHKGTKADSPEDPTKGSWRSPMTEVKRKYLNYDLLDSDGLDSMENMFLHPQKKASLGPTAWIGNLWSKGVWPYFLQASLLSQKELLNTFSD